MEISKKGLIISLLIKTLIVVVVVVLGIVAYFIFGWETYTNTNLGIEFRYPAMWNAYEEGALPGHDGSIVFTVGKVEPIPDANTALTNSIPLTITPNPVNIYDPAKDRDLTFNELNDLLNAMAVKNSPKNYKQEMISVPGGRVIKGSFTDDQNTNRTQLFIFTDFGGFYGIQYDATAGGKLQFDYLFSTLKFTKPTTASSTVDQYADWKTYTNQRYGITLKYPPTWGVNLENSDVVMVKLQDNGTPVKDGTDQIPNMFLVRVVGNLDEKETQGDHGWTTGFGNINWREIYTKDYDVVMSALTYDAEKIEDQMFSTFFKFTPASYSLPEGTYQFEEYAPKDQDWLYKLIVSSADGKWHLGLNIDGFQTKTRIAATANNVGNNLDVVFDDYGQGNMSDNQFESGDVLFTLVPRDNGSLIVWKKMQPNLQTSLANSFFVKTSSDTAPFINGIYPTSGPKGTITEIHGKNLSGFEGDLNVYFERADGKTVMLTDGFGNYPKTGGSLIKVNVVEPCQKGEMVTGEYSGIKSICDYVELTPGMYKVYTKPWGVKSNIVNFEITK